MIKKVSNLVEDMHDELVVLSEYILDHPELGNEEIKACKAHVHLLKKYGFTIEENYLGIKTAFRAEFKSSKQGPSIAYLAEYDALPEIGHGCGHNILGTTSTGAGIVLSKIISDIGGKVVVFGTPAEETCGGKVDMANQGAFDDIALAMMVHPADHHYKSGKSLAMEALQFTFNGKTAHAAACPEEGVNALDAVINTFNTINALREHIKSDARIHGIIKEGGRAANIVPDLAIAQFYVRATTKTYLTELVEKVKNCAKGASLATGTTLEIINYEYSYDNLISNYTLSEAYCKNLKSMGIENIQEAKDSYGSLDAGNVSHICPTIHPYFGISDAPIVAHSKEFAQATRKPLAYDGMKKTIGALVLTAIDVIQDKDLLHNIQEEFECIEK
ncbi:M20 family metallopeptidase [Marinisporobacter balticus]|uniref:Peptidase M20 domain-containing protein 2 n=1 Tax=Marinisporobacter balticus TaxID=2018667 RepID=A0A4R2L3Y6_9FIRM|nr:M20 family metallopeptidase [Marinisporobacter balticus]TCO78669.1 amidohydrolase [Marinisporobacter balticus]